MVQIIIRAIDLRNKNITEGCEYALGLQITVNKNMVPFDDKSPFVTSGIRVGTPAITTRGLMEDDMIRIVELIDKAIMNAENEDVLKQIKLEVNKFMDYRPLFKSSLEL